MSTAPDPGKKGGTVASGVPNLSGIVAKSTSSSNILSTGSNLPQSLSSLSSSLLQTPTTPSNAKARSEYSGTSNTPHKKTMGSYTRSLVNSRGYTVDALAQILKNEFLGRTFYNVQDIPTILFPENIMMFNFDQESFKDPLSTYRKTNFASAARTVPGFLKPYFAEYESVKLDVVQDVDEISKLRNEKFLAKDHPKMKPPVIDEQQEEPDLILEDEEDLIEAIDDREDTVLEALETRSDEEEVRTWFSNLIICSTPLITKRNAIPRSFSASFYAKPLTGKTPEKRKPDLVVTDFTKPPDDGDWLMIRIVIEITRSDRFPTRTRKAAAQRAALMLKNCPGRRFVPILLISDRQFMVAVFHRSGVSYSTKYDIVYQEHILIYLLVGFIFADLEYLGYDRDIVLDPETGEPTSIKFNGRHFDILSNPPPFVKEGVTGRGTVCFAVEDPVTKKKFILKIVWLGKKKELSEVTYLEEFKQLRLMGVTVLVGHEDSTCRQPVIFDSTEIWKPKGHRKFQIRSSRKLLMDGLGEPISEFRTKRELLGVTEDLVIILKMLCDAGFLHRDVTLRNIFLVKEYPTYPVSELPSAGDLSSNPTQLLTLADGDDIGRYRGLLADFDYVCRTLKGAAERASRERAGSASDDQSTVDSLRTGDLVSMPIQVLKGYIKPGEKDFYHTLQMDIESLLYDLLHLAIHQAGPCGLERNFAQEEPPEVYGGTTGVPTEMWSVQNETFVQLGINKASSLIDLENTIMPWIHPYFDDMKPFFREFVAALFPFPTTGKMSEDNWRMHVCSNVTVDEVLNIIRKYKKVVREPPEGASTSRAADPDSVNVDLDEDSDQDSDELEGSDDEGEIIGQVQSLTLDDPFVVPPAKARKTNI